MNRMLALAMLKDAAPALAPLTAYPSQRDFQNVVRGSWKEIDDLVERLAAKEITEREWADLFKQLLNRGHMHSWALGRQRGGDETPLSFLDALQGIRVADGDADYLLGFLDALENGKNPRLFDSEGNLKPKGVRNRMRLYAGKYRGTANEAMVSVQPAEAEIYWRLGGNEEHCTDCPTLASMSPWSKDTMWTKPGMGDTPCGGLCLCGVEIHIDDQVLTGFKPVS